MDCQEIRAYKLRDRATMTRSATAGLHAETIDPGSHNGSLTPFAENAGVIASCCFRDSISSAGALDFGVAGDHARVQTRTRPTESAALTP